MPSNLPEGHWDRFDSSPSSLWTIYSKKQIKQAYRHKKKIYKEEMEGVHDKASSFMHLDINTNR